MAKQAVPQPTGGPAGTTSKPNAQSKASALYARYGKKDAGGGAGHERPWAAVDEDGALLNISGGTNFKVVSQNAGSGQSSKPKPLTEHQASLVKNLGIRKLMTKKRERMIKEVSAEKISKLSDNHMKLLYMIQQFTTGPGVKENERWMRRQALLVMLYEGICMGVFDYDYAPLSQQVEESMLYLNVSQDAADDLDDLREALLIKTLLLTTYKHQMTVAIQLMPSGLEMLRDLEESGSESFLMAKSDVDCLIFRDQDGEVAENHEKYRLQIEFDREMRCFMLFNDAGYVQRSSVTVIENVSYVCSPYVPHCLRYGAIIMDSVPENWDIAKQVAAILTEARTDTGTDRDRSLKIKGNASKGLKQLLKLGGIRATVAEWIPYGRNHLANLNQKLGSMSKVQGGIFTCNMDNEPDRVVFENTDQQTGDCLFVLDFDQSSHVNFVAEIAMTESQASELQQVEQFGTHVHFDGTFFYGMVINSVMDKIYDSISFDYLTRVLVDIHQDSNVISDNLTTPYQRVMLDSVFGGNSSHRPKFNLIMAEMIQPWLSLEDYLDSEEKEMELQQVIGQVQSAHELAEDTYLILGTSGMLIVGDSDRILQHEMMICQYVSLRARELLMESYVSRVFQIGDILQETRDCIMTYAEDPGSLDKIRLLQSESMHEIINLQEVLSHLEISLDSECSLLGNLPETAIQIHKKDMKTSRRNGNKVASRSTMNLRSQMEGHEEDSSVPKTPKTPSRVMSLAPKSADVLALALEEVDEGSDFEDEERDCDKEGEGETRASSSGARRSIRFDDESTIKEVLGKALNIPALYSNVKLRCVDMSIHLKGNRSELDSLRYMTNYIAEQEAYRLQNQMQVNTRNLEDVFRANERSSSSLEIMQVILAGTLAFDLMDRFATLYLSTEHSAFAMNLNETVVQVPFLWLLLNLLTWALISFSLLKFMHFIANKALGVVTVRATFNIPINVDAMERMIKTKAMQSESWEREDNCSIMQCVYRDNSPVWRGEAVKIDLTYDIASRYLLKAYIQVNRGSALQAADVEDAFFEELAAHGVLDNSAQAAESTGQSQRGASEPGDASLHGSSGNRVGQRNRPRRMGSPENKNANQPGENATSGWRQWDGTKNKGGGKGGSRHARFFPPNSRILPEGSHGSSISFHPSLNGNCNGIGGIHPMNSNNSD